MYQRLQFKEPNILTWESPGKSFTEFSPFITESGPQIFNSIYQM